MLQVAARRLPGTPVGVLAGAAGMNGPFGRLRDGTGALWTGFTGHRFVRGLGDGTLPAPVFRRYLTPTAA